jgi:Uma2 family endonuclease
MSAALQPNKIVTLADLLARLGGVPLDRIRFHPAPGTAVEADVIALHDRENRLCELVEGVLVEKPMGFLEARVAALLIQVLGAFVESAELGIVAGADGMMRISAGLVRIPDVSVILWQRLPDRKIPSEPIPTLAPDLAIEVLSASNTSAEMRRKTEEYFDAGSACVWIVDPARRTVSVYTSALDVSVLQSEGMVTAELVLPGFGITVADIFRRAGLD